MKLISMRLFLVAVFAFAAQQASALVFPFEEDFNDGASNWRNVDNGALTWVASGALDGSAYVSTEDYAFVLASSNFPALFRAQDNFNSSDDAFVGNWQASGVKKIRADIRHDFTAAPLTMFARFAPSANTPGVQILTPGPVPANEWVRYIFEIYPTNPLLSVGGPPSGYNTAINAVANVQFGPLLDATLRQSEVPVTFDIDNVAIVPEPTSIVALSMTLLGGMMCIRVRR